MSPFRDEPARLVFEEAFEKNLLEILGRENGSPITATDQAIAGS
jgi:hypothetical protein